MGRHHSNGAGKTTLCKVLVRLYRQQKGQILLKDKVLSPSKRSKLTYFVMQDPDYPLYAASVGNEIMLGRQVTETLRNKAIEALENFLLVPLKDRHPASLAAVFCS
jgi:energy-coupling factor transporter ATP-binding protein EcfA2